MKPSKSLNWLLTVLLFFQSLNCISQSYGVTTVLQISPPYSSYIPDYLDPSNNQLSVIVTLNDYYEPIHEIKLKFRFEGSNYSIETGTFNYVPPISLSPGIPQVITGVDLTPYLSLENLVFNGLDPQYYQQFKSLPEGPCQVCVEVVDYYNPNQIILGNLHCQNIWFSLSDPPILNMPFCGETVNRQDPQNVYFSWSPLHVDLDLTNPTIYRFELFEMRPAGIDPNMIAANAIPYYTHEGNEPFFLYSIMEPPLIEGASYVWRVQAKYADRREKFQNHGYSQICTFEYGSASQDYLSQTLISLNSEGVSQRRGTAWWNFDPNIEEYEIEYRKSSGGNWFSKLNSATAINISNLEPETSYDVRVRAKIGNSTSDWSNTSTFVTDPALDYACNSTIFPPIPPDFEPASELIPTDIVQIGQFEMRIKSAEPTGTRPGEFRGLGTIQVPFLLMNLRVNFEDLLVDDDYIARQGNVLGITEGLTSWIESQEINNQDPIDLPGVIDSIEIQDSSIIIYFEDDTLTFNWENEPMVFQDDSGFQYSVFKDGRIVRESYLNFSMDQLEASSEYQIKFTPHQNQTYGFDEFKGNFNEVYEPILLADQSVYYVPWKSIDPGETDLIKAELICSHCNEDSVRFENEDGNLISHIKTGSKTYQISLQNISENQSIYAYYQQNKIGKINIKSYTEKHRELTIVNLTNSSISQTSISQNLEKIFLQANIKWDIQFENTSLNFDYGPDGLVQSPDASLMKKYSEEMRSIRDLYFQENPTANKNRHYLFIVPGFSYSSMEGYMVRGRSIGFITPSTSPRNIAHELAHGSGGLKHTFPEVEQGSSQNLMDYGSGELLHKDQWKELRNPFVINWFDEEEDGMMQQLFTATPGIIEVQSAESELTTTCRTFKTEYGKLVQFSSSQEDLIYQYYLDNGLLKGVFAPAEGFSGYKYFKQSYRAQISEDVIINESFGSHFTCFTCLECDLVNEFSANNFNCEKKLVTGSGGEQKYVYKFIPDKYRIHLTESNFLECSVGQNIIRNFEGSQPICSPTTAAECIEMNEDSLGGLINPNALVIAQTAAESNFSCSNEFNWVNQFGKAVRTSIFGNIACSSHLIYFTFQGSEYIAINSAGVRTYEGASFYHYIKKSAFESLFQSKAADGDSLRIKDLPDSIYFPEEYFQLATTGESIHYRMYDRFGCFLEYEFIHDGRSKYELDHTRFKNVSHEVFYGTDCRWELLSEIICAEAATINPQISDLLESFGAYTKIPKEFYDPTRSLYDPTYRNIFIAFNPGLWFEDAEEANTQFAYACGIFNGIIEELTDLAEIVTFITNYACDPEYKAKIHEIISDPSLIIEGIEDQYNGLPNHYQKAEARGRYSVMIISALVPLTKVNWVNKARNLISTVRQLPSRTLKLIAKVKSATGSKLSFVGTQTRKLVYTTSLSVQLEIGRISLDGELIIDPGKWADDIPQNYIVYESFDDIPFRKSADDVVEYGDIAVYVDEGENLLVGRRGLSLSEAWKPGWDAQRVLDIPKGQRPDPSEYLMEGYVSEHLGKFDDGGSFLVPKSALDNYGRNPVGRPDGQFIMPKSEMDNIINNSNGDISYIENELGIPEGMWQNQELVRIDIINTSNSNIRIPNGNEGGANELWIPGGILPDGGSEAVVDQIFQNNYTETIIFTP